MELVQSFSSVAIPDWVQVSRSHFHPLNNIYIPHTQLSPHCMQANASSTSLVGQKEQEFIWNHKKPFRLTFVKGLFISMRYLAFVIHIVNIVLSSIWTVEFSNAQQASEEACRILLIFQIISCYTMLLLLQLILMLRGRTAMSIYTSFGKSTHSPRHIKFGRYCIPKISLREQSIGNPTLVFIYGELLVQLVIHGLAWKRTIWDLRQYYSYPPPALLSVLNKDGLKVLMGISGANPPPSA
ncbi:hypothetical protein EV359DRAFT_59581 [Lentinula novae-zelandiae]|nr:hypothetical protein EV359DRAFT_59581 [Lentinula novae-zelandiae]